MYQESNVWIITTQKFVKLSFFPDYSEVYPPTHSPAVSQSPTNPYKTKWLKNKHKISQLHI
jgi:hypothetical protein